MTRYILLASTILSFNSLAFSMPCDTGYACKSKSGQYEINLQRCRYTNDLRLESLKIAGKEIADATLGPAYDGQSVGGKVLAFEINLPTKDDSFRVLSAEIVGKKGVIQTKTAESMPAPFKVEKTDRIKCTIAE